MLDAVSPSDAACSSVRDDRSELPAAIWTAATVIDSLDTLMPCTMRASWFFIVTSAYIRLTVSPGLTCASARRLPAAISFASRVASPGSPPSGRSTARSSTSISTSDTTTTVHTPSASATSRCFQTAAITTCSGNVTATIHEVWVPPIDTGRYTRSTRPSVGSFVHATRSRPSWTAAASSAPMPAAPMPAAPTPAAPICLPASPCGLPSAT